MDFQFDYKGYTVHCTGHSHDEVMVDEVEDANGRPVLSDLPKEDRQEIESQAFSEYLDNAVAAAESLADSMRGK